MRIGRPVGGFTRASDSGMLVDRITRLSPVMAPIVRHVPRCGVDTSPPQRRTLTTVPHPKTYLLRRTARFRQRFEGKWLLGAVVAVATIAIVIGSAIAEPHGATHAPDSATAAAESGSATLPTHAASSQDASVEPAEPAQVGASTPAIATTPAT